MRSERKIISNSPQPCSNTHRVCGFACILCRIALGRREGLLPVHGVIHLSLLFCRRNNRRDCCDDLQEDDRDHKGVCCCEACSGNLFANLLSRTGNSTRVHAPLRGCLCIAAIFRICQDAKQDSPNETSHAMYAPDIKGIISSNLLPELAASVAQGGRHNANDKSAPRLDEACCGSDCSQACNSTHTFTNKAWLLVLQPIHEHPHEARHGPGDLSVDSCGDCHTATGQGGAAIEAEPAKPQNRGACRHHWNVVRHVNLLWFHAFRYVPPPDN
mmetsp:Transcript_45645/g.90592  ORF Transcript_45645/g.90592 Transcript_45645/m.90592 type:complete len:272 (+) Transcript_45645:160-975(+)